MRNSVPNKSILFFENLSDFLTAHYAFKKAHSAHFSYESWSRSLSGISRSLLKQITSGARALPENHTPAFVAYFKFNNEEERHFLDLVCLAGGNGHKKLLKKRIGERVAYQQDLYIVKEVEKFLENPEIPVLATLFTFKDLPKDLPSLARVMNVKVGVLQGWLDILENLGFIKYSAEGGWKNTKNSFRIPEKLGAESLIKFHRLSLEKAIDGLDEPRDQRNYETLLLPMSPGEYKEYLTMVNDFRMDVLGRFNAKGFAGRHLFQVNLAISPAVKNTVPESSC